MSKSYLRLMSISGHPRCERLIDPNRTYIIDGETTDVRLYKDGSIIKDVRWYETELYPKKKTTEAPSKVGGKEE